LTPSLFLPGTGRKRDRVSLCLSPLREDAEPTQVLGQHEDAVMRIALQDEAVGRQEVGVAALVVPVECVLCRLLANSR
jgi:hypothetical protein